MRLTALIVDDEPLARAGLRMLLAEDPEVSAIHEARGGRDAVSLIREKHPDLVFLDVQMPEMDGFSVIQEVGAGQMPAIVFVTAYDQYAVGAFEVNAIDYLLKPVTRQRFALAFARSKARLQSQSGGETGRQMLSLLETIAFPRRHLQRLAVRSADKTFLVDVEDVDWIQAAENYVQVHAGRARHLVHVAMNTLEGSLDPEVFLRIHRSIIINTRRIRDLRPTTHGRYQIVLQSGVELESGRTYHERVKALTANPF